MRTCLCQRLNLCLTAVQRRISHSVCLLSRQITRIVRKRALMICFQWKCWVSLGKSNNSSSNKLNHLCIKLKRHSLTMMKTMMKKRDLAVVREHLGALLKHQSQLTSRRSQCLTYFKMTSKMRTSHSILKSYLCSSHLHKLVSSNRPSRRQILHQFRKRKCPHLWCLICPNKATQHLYNKSKIKLQSRMKMMITR